MPEEDEITCEKVFHGPVAAEDAQKPLFYKYRKFLYLFRNSHKDDKLKIQKTKKKKKPTGCDRKEIFKKNMENSWEELPNTLKRKREKISQERLSEYLDEDTFSMKSTPSDQVRKKDFPDILYLNSPDGFRNTCERFRDPEPQSEHYEIFETHPIIHFSADQLEEKITRVDQVISNGSGFQQVDPSFDSPKIQESNSSDSVINDSSVSSSASEASQNDDSGTDVGSGEHPKKPLKEMVSEFEKICTQNLLKQKQNEPEMNQYSDILFDVHPNNEGMFVNKDFEEKPKTVYQELSFEKTEEDNDEETSKHIYQEPEAEHSDVLRTSHLNADEKAKKKSAEAIAKELSAQIFAKKTKNPKTFDKHREEFLKSLGYDISVTKTDGSIVDSVKKTVIALEPPEVVENFYSVSNLLDGPAIVEEDAEDSGSVFSGDLQYFSVAEWRKAVAMGTKRGIASVAMETIVEEPETDTATKLSVREILRRFEELGNKHFNEKLFLSEEEKTATLKQIHETLKCLEEKVRLFETNHSQVCCGDESGGIESSECCCIGH